MRIRIDQKERKWMQMAPVIVTLIEEQIRSYEGVPIVPILRHNSFINELDKRHLTINSDDNHASKESG